MTEKIKIEPKLLPAKRVVEIYQVFEVCERVFEGSPILEIFCHIAALTTLIKQRDQQLIDMIKAAQEA